MTFQEFASAAPDLGFGILIASLGICLVLMAVAGVSMSPALFRMLDATETDASPRCPYCGETLSAIVVQDLERPFPPTAKWWCANEDCDAQCFGDLAAAGKPEPIEEV